MVQFRYGESSFADREVINAARGSTCIILWYLNAGHPPPSRNDQAVAHTRIHVYIKFEQVTTI